MLGVIASSLTIRSTPSISDDRSATLIMPLLAIAVGNASMYFTIAPSPASFATQSATQNATNTHEHRRTS